MDPVFVSLDAGVLRIALNRPARLNAFNQDMHRALAAAMDRAETGRDLQREVGRGEDFREGIAAFLEKRKPDFKGC